MTGTLTRRGEDRHARRDRELTIDRHEQPARRERAASLREIVVRILAARIAVPIGPPDQMPRVWEARVECAVRLVQRTDEMVVVRVDEDHVRDPLRCDPECREVPPPDRACAAHSASAPRSADPRRCPDRRTRGRSRSSGLRSPQSRKTDARCATIRPHDAPPYTQRGRHRGRPQITLVVGSRVTMCDRGSALAG